jgi:oxygen-independent coproporphyrinogen-3 oxidase
MLTVCQQRLTDAGFSHYEISAYARADRQCRHNRNYWSFGDYVGVGAGAHGKLTFPNNGLIVRTVQQREPRRYLASAPRAVSRSNVPAEELPFEFMLNALRLTDGFAEHVFSDRTGLHWSVIADRMHELSAAGLLSRDGTQWKATPTGSRFLNDLLLKFLAGESAVRKTDALMAV